VHQDDLKKRTKSPKLDIPFFAVVAYQACKNAFVFLSIYSKSENIFLVSRIVFDLMIASPIFLSDQSEGTNLTQSIVVIVEIASFAPLQPIIL
jgi:hypothetical protein